MVILQPTGGYTPWSALDSKSQTESPAQTPNGDDHKLKTPVVVSTDIQGISGKMKITRDRTSIFN